MLYNVKYHERGTGTDTVIAGIPTVVCDIPSISSPKNDVYCC